MLPACIAKLVLFRESSDSACGEAQSAVGPFFCPEDEKVYLDLGFFEELKKLSTIATSRRGMRDTFRQLAPRIKKIATIILINPSRRRNEN